LNEYHDKIFALHLHDNNATEDQHLLPYLGNLDWKHFMQTINATAYTKSFVLEASHPYEYDETEDSAELRFSPHIRCGNVFGTGANGMSTCLKRNFGQ
jgi:sugar phosphate isomerase/epimerase